MELLWIALFAVLCIGIFGLVAACEALAPTSIEKPSALSAAAPSTSPLVKGRVG